MLLKGDEDSEEKVLAQRPILEKQPAPELGNVWIVAHNVNSINTVGIAAVHDDALVHVWPEANIMTRSRAAVKDVFANAAVTLHTSQAVTARTASGLNDKNDGYVADLQSKLAIAVRQPTQGAELAIDDPDTKVLLDSGRWLETLIPVGRGDRHILVAGFYGISAASMDGPKKAANERLINYALKRHMTFKHTPYILAGDFNIDPADSEAIQLAIDEQEVVDIFAARADDAQAIHPTYANGGVYRGMAGAGITRIDAVLCNQLANALVLETDMRWELGLNFDHACLVVKFNLQAMMQQVQRLAPVMPLNLEDFFFDPPPNVASEDKELYRKLADEDFNRLWVRFEADFAQALLEKNIDLAHQLWCSAAEIWLAANQKDDCSFKALASKNVARRGSAIPLIKQSLAHNVKVSKDSKRMGFDQPKRQNLGRLLEVKAILDRAKQNGADMDSF